MGLMRPETCNCRKLRPKSCAGAAVLELPPLPGRGAPSAAANRGRSGGQIFSSLPRLNRRTEIHLSRRVRRRKIKKRTGNTSKTLAGAASPVARFSVVVFFNSIGSSSFFFLSFLILLESNISPRSVGV